LIILSTLPKEVFLTNFLKSLYSYQAIIGKVVQKTEVMESLKVLEGNFLKITLDHENEIVSFHNPSIHDFIE